MEKRISFLFVADLTLRWACVCLACSVLVFQVSISVNEDRFHTPAVGLYSDVSFPSLCTALGTIPEIASFPGTRSLILHLYCAPASVTARPVREWSAQLDSFLAEDVRPAMPLPSARGFIFFALPPPV